MALILLIFHFCTAHALEQTSSLTTMQVLSPQTFEATQVDSLKRGAATLRWKAVPNASYYKVYTTRSENFTGTREYRTSKNHLPIMAFTNETYYWRVVAFHKNGQRLSQRPTEAYTFTVHHEGDTEADTAPVSATPEVAAAPAEVAPEEPWQLPDSHIETPDKYRWSINAGGGLLGFKQSNPVMANAKSDGVTFPAGVSLQTRDYWRHYSLGLDLQNVMGSFQSDAVGITLGDKKFNWFNYAVHADAYLTTFPIFSHDARLSFSLGYAKNDTPFIESLSASLLMVRKMEIDDLTIAANLHWLTSQTSLWYLNLGYATAISAKSSSLGSENLDSAPQLQVQVGWLRNVSESLYVGGGVRAAFRSIDETMTTGAGTPAPGTRDLNYYGVEIKLGAGF